MSDDEQTPPEQDPPKKLTEKQLRLVEGYLASGNATDAARKAGYAFPNVTGPVLVKNSLPVRDAIQRGREEASARAALTLDQALGQLTTLATGAEVAAKDRISALALMGRYLGWEAPKRMEHSGPGGGPLQVQPVPTGDQAFEQLKAAAKQDPALAAELKKLTEGE